MLQNVAQSQELDSVGNQAALLSEPGMWGWVLLGATIMSLIRGITVGMVLGLGEEIGWRGFLQRELSFLGFWRSSLIVGVVWGLWHLPVILWGGTNYPQHPQAGVLMMIVTTCLASPVFAYVRLKARSVVAAAVMHGSFNASLPLAVLFLDGGTDLTVGVNGMAGFIVLGAVDVAIILYGRPVSTPLVHKPRPSR